MAFVSYADQVLVTVDRPARVLMQMFVEDESIELRVGECWTRITQVRIELRNGDREPVVLDMRKPLLPR